MQKNSGMSIVKEEFVSLKRRLDERNTYLNQVFNKLTNLERNRKNSKKLNEK